MTGRKAQQMEMGCCKLRLRPSYHLEISPWQQDLNYRKFWDFLIAEGQASQPLRPELLISRKFGGFGLSTKDARAMPFTARRLMQLSFEALLDSGIDYRGK
ncbi:hypothetical protein B0H13DRAFT_1878321 [Mycena leptocephala]|nr:hypothetical protein B0H13DRAFT_1878321 [Mycena leptocephala]